MSRIPLEIKDIDEEDINYVISLFKKHFAADYARFKELALFAWTPADNDLILQVLKIIYRGESTVFFAAQKLWLGAGCFAFVNLASVKYIHNRKDITDRLRKACHQVLDLEKKTLAYSALNEDSIQQWKE